MLLITCPVCSIAGDETEFACGGLYTAPGDKRVYARGVSREWWNCESGCGSWFGLARHTGNQRIAAIWVPGEEPGALPGEVA